jgi:anti-sigma factor (TIGR02949 family)
MKGCQEYGANIQLYFDNEMLNEDAEEFRVHFEECPVCRQAIEAEEELSRLLKSARPLDSASVSLREKIMQLTMEPSASLSYAPVSPRSRASMSLERFLRSIRVHRWQILSATATVLLISLFLLGVLPKLLARSYVEAAVAMHRSLLGGNLPLEIHSDSPDEITKWFTGKVPFEVSLPTSKAASVHETVYKLVGGRLVNYKGDKAALVSFDRQGEKVSLLIASSKSAIAAGGKEIYAGGVVYHHSKQAEFNIVTWTVGGLTYATVSSMLGSGQQSSCLVCHQNLSDRDQFLHAAKSTVSVERNVLSSSVLREVFSK